jgi:hypothetical protein
LSIFKERTMPESNAFELAEGWPHKHLLENPQEVHVSPQTAYFVRDGKVMCLRLEDLTDEDIVRADDKLREEGITYHLVDED